MSYYTLYVDESGDEGLETSKSDQLFFLGAYLVKNSLKTSVNNSILKIEDAISAKELHFSKIRKHNEKVFAFEEFSKLNVTMFGLVSDKKQLGSYKTEAEKKNRYYNKNFKFLLECVGQHCEAESKIVSSIVPEHRNQNDYGQLARYLVAVRDDKEEIRKSLPYSEGNYKRANYLEHFNFESIIKPEKKKEQPLLKVADGICHALRKLFIPDDLNIIEYRYFHEVKKLFHYSRDGEILNCGLIPVRSFDKMPLEEKTKWYLSYLENIKTSK